MRILNNCSNGRQRAFSSPSREIVRNAGAIALGTLLFGMGSAFPGSTAESEALNVFGSKFANDGPEGDPGSGTIPPVSEPETFDVAFDIQSSGKQVKNNCAVCHWLEVQIDGKLYQAGEVATLLKGKSYEITVKDTPKPIPPNAIIPVEHPNNFNSQFTVYPLPVEGQTISEVPGEQNMPPLAFIAQKDEVFQYLIDNSDGLLVRDKEWPKNREDEPTKKKAVIVPVDLAVDANRDGVIKFAGNHHSDNPSMAGKPEDKTTKDNAFRFWQNDDNDGDRVTSNSDIEVLPPGSPDYAKPFIGSKRNLEDFSRLSLRMGGIQKFIVAGDIQIGMKFLKVWSGSPAIKIFPSADLKGSDSYLKDTNAADAQIHGQFNVAVGALTNNTLVDANGKFILPASVLSELSSEKPISHFLFEGAGIGRGMLCVVFLDKNGTQIGEGPGVWIEILDIKQMYVRGSGIVAGGGSPYRQSIFLGFKR